MFSFNSLAEGVLAGNAGVVESEVKNALSEGLEASHVLEKGLIAGMLTVGERFRAGDMFLPEVLMSANSRPGSLIGRFGLQSAARDDRSRTGRRMGPHGHLSDKEVL